MAKHVHDSLLFGTAFSVPNLKGEFVTVGKLAQGKAYSPGRFGVDQILGNIARGTWPSPDRLKDAVQMYRP
jgi:hypothetical protein